MFPALAAGVVGTCMETWVSSGVAAGASGERGAGGVRLSGSVCVLHELSLPQIVCSHMNRC